MRGIGSKWLLCSCLVGIAGCNGASRSEPIRSGSSHQDAGTDASGTVADASRPGVDGSPGDADAGCRAGRVLSAERLPVDLSLLLDESASMATPLVGSNGETRWSVLDTALTNFVTDPEALATSTAVALTYFPELPDGGTAPSCASADYSTPDIALDALSSNAAAIGSSIEAHAPLGAKPTGPALEGALLYMKARAAERPGRSSGVVLVTDGTATTCAPGTISDLATVVAKAFVTEPRVRTFVVVLGASGNVADLDQLALAGGTERAMVIDGAGATASLNRALSGLSNASLACTFSLPPASEGATPPDVSLLYTDAAGVDHAVPKLAGLSACARNGDEGWYFDDDRAPTEVEMCTQTCASLAAGTARIAIGCPPVLGKP
jgi:hypothetical protein